MAGVAGRVLHAPVSFITLAGRRAPIGSAPPAARSLASLVEAGTGPLAVSEVTEEAGVSSEVGHGAVAAFAGVPLRCGPGVAGALCVADTETRSWRREEMELLVDLAVVAEAGVELARLTAEERDLRAELGRHRALLDSVWLTAPVGLGFADTELRFTRVNRALAEIDGVAGEDHLGRSVPEVLGLDPEVARCLGSVVETGEAVVDVEISGEAPARPGRPRHWWASCYPVPGPTGAVFAIGCVVVDATERRQVEEERAARLDDEHRVRVESEWTAARLASLQSLTDRLSDVGTVDEVATAVIDEVLTGLGLGGADLGLLDEGQRLSTVHRRGPLLPPGTLADGDTGQIPPLARAMASGQPVLVGSPPATDEEVDPRLGHAPGARAYVPLVLEGEALGCLTLCWAEPRTFSPGEWAFLAAVGYQCADAVERARLRQDEREARRRLSFLAEASRILGGSLDYRSALEGVVRLAVPEIAAAAAVGLVEHGELCLAAAAHVDPAEEQTLAVSVARRERVSDDILAQVVETRETATLPPPGSGGDDRLGPGLAVALSVRGRTVGVLSVWPAGGGQAVDAARWWVGDLAARVAVAVDNARLYQERVAEAQVLQRSLLPPSTPVVPGLDVSARYHPVGDASQVGGDFYDVFPIAPGRWGAVMGDVSGKGVGAAALTAMARYTVRAAAHRDESPSRVLSLLNRVILDAAVGERFCTIALAWLEPVAGGLRVTLSLGGHPAPLVVRAGGEVHPVGRAGTAIGLLPDPELADEELLLAPGDSLALYTDGLLEARSPEGSWGDGLLEAALAQGAGQDADGLASTVEESVLGFEGGRPRDDMGLLVLRVPTTDATAPFETLHAGLPPRLGAAGLARQAVRPWLAGQPLPPGVFDDVVLVVSELVTNATRAARSKVELRVWRTAAAVMVEVVDDGGGFVPPPATATTPPPEAEAGRGLYLVRVLADTTVFVPGAWGTVARCRFDIDRPR